MANRVARRGGKVEQQGDALFARRPNEHGLRGIARRTDSYGFVLLLLSVLIWVFVPAAAENGWARVVTIVVFLLAVVVSLHTSFVRARTLRVTVAVSLVLLAVTIAAEVADENTPRAIADFGFAVVLAFAAVVILRRILAHDFVTSRTISGAVAVYLLLALAFATAGTGIGTLDPGAFAATTGNAEAYGTMQYWSLVTIATLGYGDVVPVSAAARSLATLEAVAGQVYLVTIVARLVGLFGREVVRQPPPDPAEDAGGDAGESPETATGPA